MDNKLEIKPEAFIKEAFRYKRQGVLKEVEDFNETLIKGRVTFYSPVARKVNSTATGEYYFLEKTIPFLATKTTKGIIDSRSHCKDQVYMISGGYADVQQDTLMFFIEDLLPVLPSYSDKQSAGRIVGVGTVAQVSNGVVPYGKHGTQRQTITCISPALNSWSSGVSQEFMMLGDGASMPLFEKHGYYGVGSVIAVSSELNLWGSETIDTKGEKMPSESTSCWVFSRVICEEAVAKKYQKLFTISRGGMPLTEEIVLENIEPKKLTDALFNERQSLGFYPAFNRGKVFDIKKNSGKTPEECLGISNE